MKSKMKEPTVLEQPHNPPLESALFRSLLESPEIQTILLKDSGQLLIGFTANHGSNQRACR